MWLFKTQTYQSNRVSANILSILLYTSLNFSVSGLLRFLFWSADVTVFVFFFMPLVGWITDEYTYNNWRWFDANQTTKKLFTLSQIYWIRNMYFCILYFSQYCWLVSRYVWICIYIIYTKYIWLIELAFVCMRVVFEVCACCFRITKRLKRLL